MFSNLSFVSFPHRLNLLRDMLENSSNTYTIIKKPNSSLGPIISRYKYFTRHKFYKKILNEKKKTNKRYSKRMKILVYPDTYSNPDKTRLHGTR